jgi:hypothetical protein
MDDKFQILLNSKKNINSVNVDSFAKIELNTTVDKFTEYNINNTLSASNIFEAERESNEVYRLYGRIEYLSLLNNLKNIDGVSSTLSDFFNPYYPNSAELYNTSKTLLNSFNFYLLKPSATGYTNITISGDSNYYIRDFDIIAYPENFDIFSAGFSNNIFNEQGYCFNLNIDINVENCLTNITIDNLENGRGIPITDLYLFAEYKLDIRTKLDYTSWNGSGVESKINYDNSPNTYRDIIRYSNNDFIIEKHVDQIHYIKTQYDNGTLEWKFNPLIPIKLRYLSDNINIANINDVSYEEIIKIPYYALIENDLPLTDNGKRIWRDILPQGYIDPISNLGVKYPFINNRRYLFTSILLPISPNLNDPLTNSVFSNINYYNTEVINTKPLNNLNTIGKQC